MTNLAQAVREYARRHELWTEGQSILVSLSGGADSVALLHILSEIAPGDRLELRALHMNYHLRAAESDGDEEFCSRLCRSLEIPLVVEAAKQAPDGNVQRWAREERRRALENCTAATGGVRIALGHTLDDQVETLLLQLFRGGGRGALGGMRPRAGSYVRPFLSTRRDALRNYLAAHHLPFRHDRSNDRDAYRRNRVRHSLLPAAVSAFGEDAVMSLGQQAEIFALESDFLEEQARRLCARADRNGAALRLPADELRACHGAVRLRALRMLAERAGARPTRGQSLHLLELLDLPPGRRVELGNSILAERGRSDIWFLTPQAPPPPVRIDIPGDTVLPDGSVLEVRTADDRPPYPDGRRAARIRLSRDDIGRVEIRAPRAGDRMVPFGLAGSRAVFDLLSEAGVPRHRRDHSWVLTDGREIFWLLGIRQAEIGRVQPGAGSVFEFEWMADG